MRYVERDVHNRLFARCDMCVTRQKESASHAIKSKYKVNGGLGAVLFFVFPLNYLYYIHLVEA